ncbi:MAG: radical SAM protein [Nitrospirae bacterium]|nr:radical SAM protein [Nitrospirota bacterium]
MKHNVDKRSDDESQAFHNSHEAYTEKAFNTPGLMPDRYVFVLTNQCNLKCSFCCQRKNLRKSQMTEGDWLALADQLPDFARVTLVGGEPLMFKGFRKVFDSVASRFTCNVITNGVLLTEEMIDFMLSYPNFRVLSISVDSIRNTVRNIPSDKWAHVEAMIRYFAQRRDHLSSKCVLDAKTMVLDENAADLFAIHRYCVEELPFDHHSFQFLKGSPLQHSDTIMPFEEIFRKTHAVVYNKFEIIKEQLDMVRRYNLDNNKKAFLHPKVASLTSTSPPEGINILNHAEHRKDLFQPCKFPWSSVHINVDGELFPCVAVSMGNVRQQKLRDIINGPAFNEFREIIRREGTVEACNRCGWLRPA